MNDHTPTPWETVTVNGQHIIRHAPDARVLARIVEGRFGSVRPEHDAARIVACVNGCAGITDPAAAVPQMVAALEHIKARMDHVTTTRRKWTHADQVAYEAVESALLTAGAL